MKTPPLKNGGNATSRAGTEAAGKYTTKAEAKRAGATWWRQDTWPEGLYVKLANDRYFSRYRQKGQRTFAQLETDDFATAKRRHHDRMGQVMDLRETGVRDTANFKTLGALAAEFTRIVETSNRSEGTRIAYRNHLARLKASWRRGKFDTFPAHRVDVDLIIELRQYLQHEAFCLPGGATAKSAARGTNRKGYSNHIVNMTLWVLQALMNLAVEKRVRVENPFNAKATLRGKIMLTPNHRVPHLPSTETMQKLFAEMRTVRPNTEGVLDPATNAYFQSCAHAAANLAEFLAYSGCRIEEALDIEVRYDGLHDEGTLFVDGTKSMQSKRDVPVIGPLRPLLNHLKEGKKPGEKLFSIRSCRHPLTKACKRLGIPHLRQHDLRHYFATVMIEMGASFALVGEWLGHSDGGVRAAKVYGHLRREHSKSEARRITKLLNARSAAAAAKPPGNVVPLRRPRPIAAGSRLKTA